MSGWPNRALLALALAVMAAGAAAQEAPPRLDANAIIRSMAPMVEERDFATPGQRRRGLDLDIRFRVGSADLDDTWQLDQLGAALRDPAFARVRLLMVGHTDATGSPEGNLELSAKRAAAVRDHLVRRHGIAHNRLEVEGRGATQLKNPATPAAAVNRRVEVVVLPGSPAPAPGPEPPRRIRITE